MTGLAFMSDKSSTNRNIDAQRRRQRSRHPLLHLARALQRFDKLDDLLDDVTRLIGELMGVGGAAVILLDADAREFCFQTVFYGDAGSGAKLKGHRFPMDQGAAGQVLRTGKPLIVDDYARSPDSLKMADGSPDDGICNTLDVPLRVKDHIIGVVQAVNKRRGGFEPEDVELLGAVADLIALPIENARMKAALQITREKVNQLHQAKAQVIHHLSHELKTPLAVLSASIRLLERGICRPSDPKWQSIHDRIERNLHRLLEMEYKLEDILRTGDETRTDSTAPPVIRAEEPGNGLIEQIKK